MLAKLLIAVVFSVLLLVPIGAQNAFAGAAPPFDKNFVHATWISPGSPPTNADTFESDPNSPFDLFDLVFDSGGCSTIQIQAGVNCQFAIPNFVDNLPIKLIHVDVTFTGNTEPTVVFVECFEGIFGGGPLIIPLVTEPGPAGFIHYEFECEPNPDWETFQFKLLGFGTVNQVDIWTTSFDDSLIGGEIIPIESTSLILAGAQTFSWMIPVVLSIIGIGLVFVRRH